MTKLINVIVMFELRTKITALAQHNYEKKNPITKGKNTPESRIVLLSNFQVFNIPFNFVWITLHICTIKHNIDPLIPCMPAHTLSLLPSCHTWHKLPGIEWTINILIQVHLCDQLTCLWYSYTCICWLHLHWILTSRSEWINAHACIRRSDQEPMFIH